MNIVNRIASIIIVVIRENTESTNNIVPIQLHTTPDFNL